MYRGTMLMSHALKNLTEQKIPAIKILTQNLPEVTILWDF